MSPTTHHKTLRQSTPPKQRPSRATQTQRTQPRKSRTPFAIADALFLVAIGEIKTAEAIRLVIALAANESLTETSSEALGAIAGKAGCRKADNPYDRNTQRTLFGAFQEGLKIGRLSAGSVKSLESKQKQRKPSNLKAGQTYRHKRLH